MLIRALSTDDHSRSHKVGGCGPVAESLRLVREKKALLRANHSYKRVCYRRTESYLFCCIVVFHKYEDSEKVSAYKFTLCKPDEKRKSLFCRYILMFKIVVNTFFVLKNVMSYDERMGGRHA